MHYTSSKLPYFWRSCEIKKRGKKTFLIEEVFSGVQLADVSYRVVCADALKESDERLEGGRLVDSYAPLQPMLPGSACWVKARSSPNFGRK